MIAYDKNSTEVPSGAIAIWPLGSDGRELTWSLSKETLERNLKNGYVRFGPWNGEFRTPYYLTSGQIKDIETKGGELRVCGKDEDGALIVEYGSDGKKFQPLTVWNQVSHSATEHGTGVLKNLLPDRSFPFPKSLYAVEDSLKFFVGNKPKATVVDFFSGSGTTCHAVMRLNKLDNGTRKCIAVTNNEVAESEQKALRTKGLRPGDPNWERFGICDFITKPRIKAAITGEASSGDRIKGEYKFNDEFPMSDGLSENAEFFTLTYESPLVVSHNLAFERIAPLLWLRAGSVGKRIDAVPIHGWEVVEAYGVLIDLDKSNLFIQQITKVSTCKLAYIVTNDDRRFQAVARTLPVGVEPVRLYESYINNFQFANGE